MPRYVFLFAICTGAHFAAAIVAFAWSFSVTSNAFDGRPIGAISRHLAGPLADTLGFPLLAVMDKTAIVGVTFSPVLQWLLLLGNSAIWGMAVSLIITYYRKRYARDFQARKART